MVSGGPKSYGEVSASVAVATFACATHCRTCASQPNVLVGGVEGDVSCIGCLRVETRRQRHRRRRVTCRWTTVNWLRVHKQNPLTRVPKWTHVIRELHEDLRVRGHFALPQCPQLPFGQTWDEPHTTTQEHGVLLQYKKVSLHDK